MADPVVLTRDQVERIVAVFSAVAWPVASTAAGELGAALGWTVRADREMGMDFDTGARTNSPQATMSYHDGMISRVAVDASDRFRAPDASQEQGFADAARALRDGLSVLLGDPVRERGGKRANVAWDLPNGGRIVVERLNRVVQVVVVSKRYADLERREEGLGIPDERDPDAPENDLA